MAKCNIIIRKTPKRCADEAAKYLLNHSEEILKNKKSITIALSGGKTPIDFYRQLASEPYVSKFKWDAFHFFWADERCVPPNHPESNFHLAKNLLFDQIEIPKENIHLIHGDKKPDLEIIRYNDEISEIFGLKSGELPQFDLIVLGVGIDGHTASIFPGFSEKENKVPLMVTTHPMTNQRRITLSLATINSARRIYLLVHGEKKSKIVSELLGGYSRTNQYPAAKIKPKRGIVYWFLDEKSASALKRIQTSTQKAD